MWIPGCADLTLELAPFLVVWHCFISDGSTNICRLVQRIWEVLAFLVREEHWFVEAFLYDFLLEIPQQLVHLFPHGQHVPRGVELAIVQALGELGVSREGLLKLMEDDQECLVELRNKVLETPPRHLSHVVIPTVAPITVSLPRVEPDLLEQPILVLHFLFDVLVFLQHFHLVLSLFFLLVFYVFETAAKSVFYQVFGHHLFEELVHVKGQVWLGDALGTRVELEREAVALLVEFEALVVEVIDSPHVFLQLGFDAVYVECNLFTELVHCLVQLFRIDRLQRLLLKLILNFFSEFNESALKVYL